MLPGGVVAGQHLGHGEHAGFEGVAGFLGVVVQRDADERHDSHPQRAAVQDGLVAADHARRLQALQPFPAGRGRQRDAFGQFGVAQAAIFLKDFHDFPIDRVKLM
ncbi:hypothetical protein D3C87_1588860 [compost metagenome]